MDNLPVDTRSNRGIFQVIAGWIEAGETRFCVPAYGGWVLIGIAIAFFAAATNTMAGWLYVLTAMMLAILFMSAWLSISNLKDLKLERGNIVPVSVGEDLIISVTIDNTSPHSRNLIEVYDLLPIVVSQPLRQVVETIPPQSSHRIYYHLIAQRRGVYQWQEMQLRTANPLGLFWRRQLHSLPAKMTVYPAIIPLSRCPLIDSLGQDDSLQFESDRLYQDANQGVTKALRPYRFGDPTRLIHWRASARLGELKVRELEIITGGQNIIIALDATPSWDSEEFELAVTTAISLYAYGTKAKLNVQLWTPESGIVHGRQNLLETLAAIKPIESNLQHPPYSSPLIWITSNPGSLNSLSSSSRWILFAPSSAVNSPLPGILIRTEEPLIEQLQQRKML